MKPAERGIELIGDILTRGISLGKRHERTRAGARTEIPNHIRSAVWWRDRGQCDICGTTGGKWELDHITPWSAGGSDTTDNLRVLCVDCNQERSNRHDPRERPMMPATWWCIQCYTHSHQWMPALGVDPPRCPRHRYACNVVRGMQRYHDEHEQWPNWYLEAAPIDPEIEPLVVAFCAHCLAPGLTARAL